VVFGVPRVWERFYKGIYERLNDTTGVRAWFVTWARGVARRVTDLHNRGLKPSTLLAMQYRLAGRLVLSKVKEALGLNQARMCFVGAAPINPHILEFLSELDINVWEVYGQSEGTGGTSTNFCGNARYGTVGKPLPGVEVKLAEDGEILLKGGNVFLGYYKDPEATAEILRDGWLHSGDLGEIDTDGFLTVTGRKKDIIITSGGKNIAPKNIEVALMEMDLVAQALVFGEGRRYITALLTLDDDAAECFAAEHGADTAELHKNADLLAAIQQGVDEVNTHLARVEQVRGFYVAPEPFRVETGELTPTLKMKRQVVYEHYTEAIEAMYAE
jgi:long-chain acyl-CoA synthetase